MQSFAGRLGSGLHENQGGLAMSFIANGGAQIYISKGQTHNWVFTWNNPGWQGNTLNQPQPLDAPASMSYTEGIVSVNRDNTYSFPFSVTNNTPSPIYYNLQTSSS